MAKAFRLQFLLDLANDKMDKAAREMSAALGLLEQARHKLNQLQTYRAEYQAKLQKDSFNQGMSAHQWRDFYLFLAKLDQAIATQEEEIIRCEIAYEASKQAWTGTRRETQAFSILSDRHHMMETQKELKREQKQLDEFSMKLFSSGHSSR